MIVVEVLKALILLQLVDNIVNYLTFSRFTPHVTRSMTLRPGSICPGDYETDELQTDR